MKLKLLPYLGLALLAPFLAFAGQVSVPSAISNGSSLFGLSSGNYQATSTVSVSPTGVLSTNGLMSTASSTVNGNLVVTGTVNGVTIKDKGFYDISIADGLSSFNSGHFNVGIGGLTSIVNASNNTAVGINSGLSALGDGNIFYGFWAGGYETGSNSFYIDNQDRGSTAGDKGNALLYGIFAAAAANQNLTINAHLNVVGSTTLATSLNGFLGASNGQVYSFATSTLPFLSTTLAKGNFIVGNDAGVAQATSSIFITSVGDVVLNDTDDNETIDGTTYKEQLAIHNSGSVQKEALSLHFHSNTPLVAPNIVFHRSDGTGAPETIVQSGDTLGRLVWNGYDGVQAQTAAGIFASVDGVPGADDMPGRLDFYTTADGAKTLTKRLTINNAGAVIIATTTAGVLNISSTGVVYAGTGGSSASSTLLADVNTWTNTQAMNISGSAATAASSTLLANTNTFSGTDIFTNNVGIGSTTPFAKLSLKATGSTFGANFQTTNSNNTPNFTILDNGNVGIATTTPDALLSVVEPASGANFRQSQIKLVSFSGNVGVVTDEVIGGIDFVSNDINAYTTVGAIRALATASHATPNMPTALIFDTYGTAAPLTERMRINGNGNIGIGTSTPTDLLHIASTLPRLYLTDTDSALDNKHWFMENNAGVLAFGTTSDALAVSTTRALKISNTGTLTIATTTAGQLAVSSTGVVYSTTAGSGTVTAVTGGWPVISSGGVTPNITWAGLATTSQPASSNLLVSNGGAGVFGVGTSTLTATYPFSVTNSPVIIGTSGAVISSAFGTTTNIGIGNNLVLYTGATGIMQGVSTSTIGTFLGSQSAGVLGTSATGLLSMQGTTTLYGALGTPGMVLTSSGGVAKWMATSTGTVSNVTATWPILSSGGATPSITWGGLATTSAISAASGLLYATGVNTFASIATSSAVSMSITGNAGSATDLTSHGAGVYGSAVTGVPSMQATSTLFGAGFVINQTGNTGFGTSTPWAHLSVAGDGNSSPIFAVATTSNQGLPNFMIDGNGHAVYSGVKPTCDANCTFSAGNDSRFRVITGAAKTTMTVTFSKSFGTNAPICVADEGSAGVIAVNASSTPTTVVLTALSALTSADIDVHCDGIQ